MADETYTSWSLMESDMMNIAPDYRDIEKVQGQVSYTILLRNHPDYSVNDRLANINLRYNYLKFNIMSGTI